MTPLAPRPEAFALGDGLALTGGSGQHATKLGRSIYSGRVAAVLREAIIDGTLHSGTPLVEARVADELAVSRGPVRSALHVLEGEGLVRTLPNGRTEVVGFAAEDLRDLFRVRFELEGTAIRWGAERAAPTAPLELALAAFEVEGATTPRLVELDIAFHRALVQRSGSRFLVEAWQAIAPVIQTVITIGNRRLAAADPATHFRRIVASHEPLIEAIRDARPDAAAALLHDQLELTASMFGDAQGEDR
ncbi:GntR family transcriptional regulator [Conexibacter woesei]|uniref:Transcriptional regulator, GntR family n=1 Tax=Conexibacter woesei (strain DSM 14684 / CCUG 47730 / CIP 108061 / JCM 11494 / NBRC 100937 / ID131577) TaxID=469383 RepID=D3F6T8_CONWI|nr:GntR family transcriptional regulator [Conexibacter woesei]ADB52736.1 transcriptional regulator, GntR family [Conexibacter woesei DSM 14684]